MTEALRLQYLESAGPKRPCELRKAFELRMLREAEEDAKSRQSQTEPVDALVLQELNPNEADETLVEDEPATQSHEINGSESANCSGNMTNGHDDLAEDFAKFNLGPKEKTPGEIWNELTNVLENSENPKLARYRSLDVTPDPSWFKSILSKVNSILEETADEGQLRGGDEDSAIERRNYILKILMQGALELGSQILDSPEIAGKLAAQRDAQNEDPRDAVTSDGTGADNPTDENTILAVTGSENCSNAVAPYQEVEVLEEPTLDPRDRLRVFDYIPEASPSLFYTIELFEQIYSLRLKKHREGSREKTVARLYVPKTTPRSNAPKIQIIDSISGWGGTLPDTTYPSTFISNEIWTRRVQDLCQATGYPLEPSKNDESGYPGSYNACHAEKQIIAYWLYNYVLSSRDTESWKRWDKRQNEPIRPEYYEGLHIDVSKYSCDCCVSFMNHIAAYYAISFTVYCQDGEFRSVFEFPH